MGSPVEERFQVASFRTANLMTFKDQSEDSFLVNIPLDDLNEREIWLYTHLGAIKKYQAIRRKQQDSSIRTHIKTATNSTPQVVSFVPECKGDYDEGHYERELLPELRRRLGRDPILGDRWFEGGRFLDFNGQRWVG